MAGAGSRFEKAGYTTPKPLISVNEKPMVVCAIQDLPACKKTILIHQSKHIDADTLNAAISPYVDNISFINVDQLTQGQACTCLLARAHLDPQKSVLIGACDNGMIYDQSKFSKATEDSDCLVFTFRNNPTVVHKPQQYGWCDVDDTGMIKRMSVKRAISNNPIKDHAVVGAFWFKQSDIFTRAADKMIAENRRINNEFYVDELINDVIDLGYTVRVFEIDNYICWGTPDDLKTYQYWQTFWKAENNV
ncbi:MAG: nucleotidyltransferase [Proteobacteria bacterium]|nr:nucleotidyltransferase [Pseudomonadota bacterium]